MWTVRRLRRRTTARNNKPDKKSTPAKKTNSEEKETSEKEDRDMDEKDEDTTQTVHTVQKSRNMNRSPIF